MVASWTGRARRAPWLAALLLVVGLPLGGQRAPRSARPSGPPVQLRGLDAWVERALEDWGVPGLAVAVVKDDSLMYARGFGVRRVGDTARVTERTLFAVTGQSWDEFVKRRIFRPLGMTATTTSVSALDSAGDVAAPHTLVDGRMQPVAWRNIDNIAPAGAINSSVREMAQWVRLQLGAGAYDGARLIAAASVKEMHAAQTVIPVDTLSERLWPSTHFRAYGLGWSLSDYRGRKLVGHGGAIDGMRAQVTLVPEERLGVVVLANGGEPSRLLTQAVAFRVVDAYLGSPAPDWSTTLLAVRRQQVARDSTQRAQRDAERVPGTQPALPLERYAGTYRSTLGGATRWRRRI